MSTTISNKARPESDPIDALIPAPRSTWARLAIGVTITAVAGTIAFLWGFGYLIPSPAAAETRAHRPSWRSRKTDER